MRHNIKHCGSHHQERDRLQRASFHGGILGSVLVFTIGGCQNEPAWELAPVEGTITHAGKPLAGVHVTFLADVEAGTQGPQTSGISDDAGHYRLLTDGGKRGAAIGQYRVCVVDPRWQMVSSEKPSQGKRVSLKDLPSQMKNRIPDIYASFRTTPLRAEVRSEGVQTFDFDIP